MKKLLVGCLAIMLTMAMWAFTQPKEAPEGKPSTTAVWYYYDGIGDEFSQESYTLEPQSTDCSGSTNPCAILAEPDGTDPDIPDQDDVNAAASSSSNFTVESGLVDLKS
jgi:hypothetical protein